MRQVSKKAILYLRVSTEEQVDNFSLGTQEEICNKEAEKRHLKVDKIFKEEGKSAKSIAGRPILIKLLEYCRKNKKKIDSVIVYRIDRISRATADYLAIRQKLTQCGINVISATEPTGDSPTEKLVETILAGFAQLDNDIRSERSKNGMYARFKSGLTSSPPPFGYIRVNGFVYKDEASFDKIRKAWDLMATGTKTIREIADIMSKWGLKKVKDGKKIKITYKFVHRIFRSIFYTGILSSPTYQEEVQGQHIPMVTMEAFLKVREIIDGKSLNKINAAKKNKYDEDFPLRKLIKCGKCKWNLTASWSKGGKYPYYYCIAGCKSPYISRKIMNAELDKLLLSVDTKSLQAISSLILKKVFLNHSDKLRQRERANSNQLQMLNDQRQSLIQKNLAGIYSDEIFTEQYSHIEQQLKNIALLKEKLPVEEFTLDKVRKNIETILADLPNAFALCGVKQKRTFLGLLFPNGLVWNYPGLTARQIS